MGPGRHSVAAPRGRAVPPWPPPTLRLRVPSRRIPARSAMAGNGERTFIAIKPDGVQRGLVGEIIKRFEQKGFRLVAMKFVHVSARALPLNLVPALPEKGSPYPHPHPRRKSPLAAERGSDGGCAGERVRPGFLPGTWLLPFPKKSEFCSRGLMQPN